MKFSYFSCSWIVSIVVIFCVGCATNSQDKTGIGKRAGDVSPLAAMEESTILEQKRRETQGTKNVVQPVMSEMEAREVQGTKHIVQVGDTVAKLSKQYYNEINRKSIQRIVDVNPGVRFPRPKVGTEIVIPSL